MALIKQKVENHMHGDYWMIVQRNRNRGSHPDCVVELCLYLSKEYRAADKAEGIFVPLPISSVIFNFTADDHPLDEIEPDEINPEWITDPHTIETHMLYLHIRKVAQVAASRVANGLELSRNESAALFFFDAVDDVP